MPQSLANVVVHLVFSTKHRAPYLHKPLSDELHSYLGGILLNSGCSPLEMGGVEDHVHILFGLSRTISLAQVAEKVKTSSSKWLKTKGLPEFAWQSGYAALSVDVQGVLGVREYIRGQEAHHRRMSFQEEYRSLLMEHGIEFDERYMWD